MFSASFSKMGLSIFGVLVPISLPAPSPSCFTPAEQKRSIEFGLLFKENLNYTRFIFVPCLHSDKDTFKYNEYEARRRENASVTLKKNHYMSGRSRAVCSNDTVAHCILLNVAKKEICEEK